MPRAASATCSTCRAHAPGFNASALRTYSRARSSVGTTRSIMASPSSVHHEHALAARSAVKEAKRFVGLIQREAMGNQTVDRNSSVDGEAGALLQANGGKRPRAVECQMAMDDVRAW